MTLVETSSSKGRGLEAEMATSCGHAGLIVKGGDKGIPSPTKRSTQNFHPNHKMCRDKDREESL